MRILIVGAGGVGSSAALIAARRDFFESIVIADYDQRRAQGLVERLADARFAAAQLDAGDAHAIAALCREHRVTHVLNAVDPRYVLSIFSGAFLSGAHYLDTAMSLSSKHPERPYELPGVLLGEEQFAQHTMWEETGQLALVGMGVEPGLADVFARYAADELFSEIDELGVRDASNLVVSGYDFAPSFSIWTVIEECLNPPLIWERDRGFHTTEPFSEPEVFEFPEGIGPVECVNVEHEEVVLMPRVIDARRVTFKFGLGDEFIEVLKTLRKLGLDRTEPVTVRGHRVAPRDVVAACLPDPLTLGDRMTGKTCAGVWVTGTGRDGQPREVYLYHVADNDWTMREYGAQAVVWQTAMNPVVALELLATGAWSGSGVLGPESFPPLPFLELLRDGYGQQWVVQEREPRQSPA
ncbi:MAG TPA: saccharopine dehydrogenase C-terminal domain-containing protein [Candidatus Nanopelagicales bacterium]